MRVLRMLNVSAAVLQLAVLVCACLKALGPYSLEEGL